MASLQVLGTRAPVWPVACRVIRQRWPIGLAVLVAVVMSGHGWAAPQLARSQDRSRFTVTTFASGLAFPTSMTQLADGSLLVATSAGGANSSLWSSGVGSLVRLVDGDGDGIADGDPQVLATGLPGLLTSVRRVGDTVVALSSPGGNQAITFLRTGSSSATPLTVSGALRFSFASGFEHTTYTLAARVAPGGNGTEIYFNVGAKANASSTSPVETVGLSGTGVSFTTSSLLADSVYRVTMTHENGTAVVSAPVRIAAGLRNAAGMVFDPSGNLWLQDNGIDDPANRSRALSADEINVIAANDVGVTVPDFGFAATYTRAVPSSGRPAGSRCRRSRSCQSPGKRARERSNSHSLRLPSPWTSPLAVSSPSRGSTTPAVRRTTRIPSPSSTYHRVSISTSSRISRWGIRTDFWPPPMPCTSRT